MNTQGTNHLKEPYIWQHVIYVSDTEMYVHLETSYVLAIFCKCQIITG